MTAKADLNLGGRWSGIFNYPEFLPPTGFEAVLSDDGGAIGGTIVERDENPRRGGGMLRAFVEGRRRGAAITFTKMYEDSAMPDAVFYSGTIEPDGNEISGRWEIPGNWSGTFLMVRNSGGAEAEEAEVGREMPVATGSP